MGLGQKIRNLFFRLGPNGLPEAEQLLSDVTYALLQLLVCTTILDVPASCQVPVVQIRLQRRQQLLKILEVLGTAGCLQLLK